MTHPSPKRAPSNDVDPARLAVFVIGGTEQSGKTTVALRCAHLLSTPAVASSTLVNPRVEARLGLKPGTITAARAADHSAYRADLIEETRLMHLGGIYAGPLCVEAGFRVIDGMRRVVEVEAACRAARERGWSPVVIFVRRAGRSVAGDNTETDGLRAISDVIIENDGQVDDLIARTDAALRRFIDRGRGT